MVINPGGTIASPINLVTAGASVVLANKLTGADANNDFQITGAGKIQWGAGGASALDTDLYRTSAGVLRTTGSITVDTNLTVSTNLGVTGTTTVGGLIQSNKDSATILAINTPATNFFNIALASGHIASLGWSGAAGTVGTSVITWGDNTGSTSTLGFFGTGPIVQPSAVGTATGYAAGTTAATFHSDDTYTGNVGTTAYTINGVVAALKTLGLIAS